MNYKKAVTLMSGKFASGNAIPVERAQITRAEWDAVLAELHKRQVCIDQIETHYENGFHAGAEYITEHTQDDDIDAVAGISAKRYTKQFQPEDTQRDSNSFTKC